MGFNLAFKKVNTFSFNFKISRDNYRKHSRIAKCVTINANEFINQCIDTK